MDMITAVMQPFYEQIKREEQNRKEMLGLFNQTGRVERDDEDTDIVFGRTGNETL